MARCQEFSTHFVYFLCSNFSHLKPNLKVILIEDTEELVSGQLLPCPPNVCNCLPHAEHRGEPCPLHIEEICYLVYTYLDS